MQKLWLDVFHTRRSKNSQRHQKIVPFDARGLIVAGKANNNGW